MSLASYSRRLARLERTIAAQRDSASSAFASWRDLIEHVERRTSTSAPEGGVRSRTWNDLARTPRTAAERWLLDWARRDVDGWIDYVFDCDLWSGQRLIARDVAESPDVAVRTCHAIGKDHLSGRLVIWWLATRPDSLVVTTGPTDRQVRGILWKEIGVAWRARRVPIDGHCLLQELHIGSGLEWSAFGFTAKANETDRFSGWHAKNGVLVIVDEAAGVPSSITDEALAGILTGDGSRMLQIGNPTSPLGPFYRSFRHPEPDSRRRHFSAFSTPNFLRSGVVESDLFDGAWRDKVAAAGIERPYLIDPAWAARWGNRWGRQSPIYAAKVLGEFPATDVNSLIPLAWVEAAFDRYRAWIESGVERGAGGALGVDVARFGDDQTAAYRAADSDGVKVATLEFCRSQIPTSETTGLVRRAVRERGCDPRVDADGLGAGVVDQLAELGEYVVEIHGGGAPMDSQQFKNWRAEAYWSLRDQLDPDKGATLAIEPDSDLQEELVETRYKLLSGGQIQIESKDELKRRLGRSPDRADALIYACAENVPARARLW